MVSGETGGGVGGTGVEVAAVAVNPNFVTYIGDVIDVTVTLTKPASAGGVTLLAAVLFDQGAGNYQTQDPSGFTFPQPITVAAGGTVAKFQMVRNGQPVASGNCVVAVEVEGGNAVEGASFVIN